MIFLDGDETKAPMDGWMVNVLHTMRIYDSNEDLYCRLLTIIIIFEKPRRKFSLITMKPRQWPFEINN